MLVVESLQARYLFTNFSCSVSGCNLGCRWHLSADREKEVRFECLRCGKVSPIEGVKSIQPRCARCGSGTGVLGDIGQGTASSRRQRDYGSATKPGDPTRFECLRCGEVTTVRKITVQSRCPHCGAKDGVIVEGEA
jgi:Zn finger protein HypA/HybF involved in hydrogenase expression